MRVSLSWHCFMSTKNPKCLKKSAPRIGCCTSTTMNIHGNARLNPRLSVRDFLPYVRIGVSLTAARFSLSGGCLQAVEEGGTTLTSEPVSTNKRVCVCKSFMKNRRLGHLSLLPGLGVFPIAWLLEFLSCHAKLGMVPAKGICGQRLLMLRGRTRCMVGCKPPSLAGMNLQGCNQLGQTHDVLAELFDF